MRRVKIDRKIITVDELWEMKISIGKVQAKKIKGTQVITNSRGQTKVRRKIKVPVENIRR